MTIGILSWGAHKTLRNTLESYERLGLTALDQERVILFQEMTALDSIIAEDYGYKAIGQATNIGIAQGYKRLVEVATGDLFLFLENDWTLIENPEKQIHDAGQLLRGYVIDVARFRHRKYPGEPLYTRQFAGHEEEHPTHMLDSIHWTDPDKFYGVAKLHDWYVTNAHFANWTNNPTMFRTEWLKTHILPRIGDRDAEVDLQPWWEQQRFLVAQSDGLFTHNRIG